MVVTLSVDENLEAQQNLDTKAWEPVPVASC